MSNPTKNDTSRHPMAKAVRTTVTDRQTNRQTEGQTEICRVSQVVRSTM